MRARGSIVARVGVTVGALTVAQAVILLVVAIVTFRSQLAVARVLIVEEGVALARLAVTPAEGAGDTQARLQTLAGLEGFAIALYDADGHLLRASRQDVAVERSLSEAARRDASTRGGGAVILRATPEEPTAAIAALGPRSGAAFVGIFEQNTVQQVARGRILVSVASAAGVVIFSLLLTAWLARRARTSLREIEGVMHRMADGDLSVRLPVRSDDEVGRVVGDFNRMADSLAARLEELRRSEAARRETEAQRSRLFAAFTHEISTPLTSVLGYLESLRMGDIDDDPETRRRYVEIAYTQARALDALAEDLATLSRLDFEGLGLERGPLELAELCRAELAAFESRAAERGVRIELATEGDTRASLDAQRIGQVVRILADNALRYAPDGSSIRVTLTGREQTLALEVADEGPGVAPEQLARLGEPLYRADASRTRGTGGRGLGLSIARGIARAHGGELAFASEPGHGLVATLSLPR